MIKVLVYALYAICIFKLPLWIVDIFLISKTIFGSSVVLAILVQIFLFLKLYKGQVPKTKLNNKYVYHLTSRKNINSIKMNDRINIKRTKNIFKNYSMFGRGATYFHTDLRGGYSYFYNHFLKFKKPDILIIVPLKNLNLEKIQIRNIDKTLLYLDDYFGHGKIVNVEEIKFFNRVNARYLKYFILDFMNDICLLYIFISLLLLVVVYV